MKLGYQLYSAREDAQKDLKGTLKALAAQGYDGIEIAGFFDWKAHELAHLMHSLKLKPFSSHVPLRQIEADPHAVIAYHQALGCRYVVVPYLEDADRPGTPRFASVLQTIAEFGRLCRKADLKLLYHNHDFEFVELSGETALDFLFEAIPERVLQTELDTCWIKYAGADPAAYVGKYSNRAPVVHIKDFVGKRGENPPYALIGLEQTAKPAADEPFCFKPVGYGCQDVGSLVKAAQDAGAKWLVVEQDESPERPALEAAGMSIETLRKYL